MAVPWDRRHPRPILSNHNSYQGQTAIFQPPLSEHLANMRLPNLPNSEHHNNVKPVGPPLAKASIVPVPYYEGYTIKPDDIASSEKRWSFPPKMSIPVAQEDLHTEVIRHRQSGRTACRELEDCHGPKRQYIDRLIMERNASTSEGHFEVAQLRLERIPRDSGKASNRSGGRNYHTHDYKQKDSTKPKLKTVYMHIILQFVKDPSRSRTEIAPDKNAPCNPNVGKIHSNERQDSSEDFFTAPISSIDQPSLLHGPNQRPIHKHSYITEKEQIISPSSSRYISRGTQTTSLEHTKPNTDENTEDAPPGGASGEDNRATNANVEDEMPRCSPSSDDEIVSTSDSPATRESENETTGKEAKGTDEYEKPPWFQNLQPVKSPGVIDEQGDVYHQQDEVEASTTDWKKDADDPSKKDGEGALKAHEEGGTDYTQANNSPGSEGEISQMPLDHTIAHMDHDEDDRSHNYVDTLSLSTATEVENLESIDEHPSTAPTNMPMSEYLSSSQRPAPQERVPPSERYKPRAPLNVLPARPSLIRASATYDSGSTDDTERKSSKRVSFQQAPTPLYTPPSTTTSSPISPTASPQLPLRTILTKPPPVSIPPGHYTPIASSSPSESQVSPSSPAATSQQYTCIVPSCETAFDHPYDRDRHERQQHTIGDPLYSECPVCHHSCSSSVVAHGGFRELLIAHMNRRH